MPIIQVQTDQEIELHFTEEDAGKRLDKALADGLSDISRGMIQSWIKNQCALLDGKPCKPRQSVRTGQSVMIQIPEVPALNVTPETIELDIVYEDQSVIVINKPAGLVVHPGAGNHTGTLLNGLLSYQTPLAHIARGGIVHRLDKQTTGLMVVAKTEVVRQRLVKQLSERSVKREYQALVYGSPVAGGQVKAAIGRHAKDRKKMMVRADGKHAVTHYRIGEKYRNTTLLQVFLETGRTHQIRVHMLHKNLPLVGDPVYGKRLHLPVGASESLVETMRTFRRQALHARKLSIIHPETSELISWEAPMPEDMQRLCSALAQDIRIH